MEQHSGRLVAGAGVLAVTWIAVYWLYEPGEPAVTLGMGSAVGSGVTEPGVEGGAGPDGADDALTSEPGPAASPIRSASLAPTVAQPQPISRPEPTERAVPRTPSPARAAESDGGSGSEAAPRVVVEPPRFRDYVVRPGDNPWRIAEREFGAGRWSSAIAKANPYKDVSRLRPGEVIRLPIDPANIQGRSVAAPAGTGEGPLGGAGEAEPEPLPVVEYIVERGDSLSVIAQRYYGSSRHTDFLFEANRDRLRSKNDLRIGQTILIPPLDQPARAGAGESGD